MVCPAVCMLDSVVAAGDPDEFLDEPAVGGLDPAGDGQGGEHDGQVSHHRRHHRVPPWLAENGRPSLRTPWPLIHIWLRTVAVQGPVGGVAHWVDQQQHPAHGGPLLVGLSWQTPNTYQMTRLRRGTATREAPRDPGQPPIAPSEVAWHPWRPWTIGTVPSV